MRLMKLSFIAFFTMLVLASCSISGEDKQKLAGERIGAFEQDETMSSEYENYAMQISDPLVNLVWSQAGGNETHNMPNLYVNGIRKAWKTDFGKGSSSRDKMIATPVVAYDGIFTIDANARVSAYNLGDGKIVWKKNLKPAYKEQKDISMKGAGIAVSVKQNKVYATTGFGGVFALDMLSGKNKWNFWADMPIRIAPTVGTDIMFVQTVDNSLIALDMETGEEIWRAKTTSEDTTLVGGASPAYDVARDVVIAAFSNGEIRAYKASTGSMLWSEYLTAKTRGSSNSGINDVKSSPIIDGDFVYVSGNNGLLVALSFRSGERIWAKAIATTNSIYVADGCLFILSNDFKLMALDKKTGGVVWASKLAKGKEFRKKVGDSAFGPVMVNGNLVVATNQGYVFVKKATDGSLVDVFEIDTGVEVSPIVANESIIFTTKNAKIISYR